VKGPDMRILLIDDEGNMLYVNTKDEVTGNVLIHIINNYAENIEAVLG
jgi:hypothetical protein